MCASKREGVRLQEEVSATRGSFGYGRKFRLRRGSFGYVESCSRSPSALGAAVAFGPVYSKSTMDAAKQGIEPVVRAITEADDSTFKLALGPNSPLSRDLKNRKELMGISPSSPANPFSLNQ